MKEYIFLNIGSTGINLAQSYWHLFCLEHGISPNDGEPDLLCLPKDDDNSHVIFRETKTIPYGPIKYTPRSVFVGEQSEIDSIRAGSCKNLFPAESLIDCPSECGGVYSKSYMLKVQLEKTIEQMRKETELADSIEGFMLFNSIGGGLGSGFTNALLEQLGDSFGKTQKAGFNFYPVYDISSKPHQVINSILALAKMQDLLNLSFVLDNSALARMCTNQLERESASFKDMNSIATLFLSQLTCSMRNDGALNTSLSEMESNLVPYPTIHNIVSSMAPLYPAQKVLENDLLVTDITLKLFEQASFMQNIDINQGKYMACAVVYQGDIVPKDVGHGISRIKTSRTIQFVDWCPTGFKCGINYQTMHEQIPDIMDIKRVKRGALMLGNSSSYREFPKMFVQMSEDINALKIFKKDFECIEESDYDVALEQLKAKVSDYTEIEAETVEDEGQTEEH
ncbi:hypothetical protein FGO68_gene1749 [Halteria grandinella]|uniref:Tubulin alpha chain n=1 Tax=Halteria grandinella TaxID=5974 RepID=A0A8J8NR25_HALGN|nr:hypothetical protein FGO68_gene1749 [Halteria grandinella]